MDLIFVDVKQNVVSAWEEHFKGANSIGYMDGGLDMLISEYFGWHVQDRLQDLIRDKHHGELLVGTAEIVPTDNSRIP